MVKWLRENTVASYLLTIVRLWLGYHWITAGWGKITGGFDASGFLQGAVAKAGGEHPQVQAWWADFLSGFAIPNAGLFNVLIPYGEFLVGLGLILGTLTTAAAFFGVVMNFAFFFSGTVSDNPQMIIVSFLILVAGANAGQIGLDRWVLPYIRRFTNKKEETEVYTKAS